MSLDFSKYLSIKGNEVEKPKPIPIGTYYGFIRSFKGEERQYNKDDKNDKTPVISFTIHKFTASDDVDQTELGEFKGLENRVLTRDFSLREDQIYRLDEFLTSLGISGDDRTFGDRLNDTVNQPVMVAINQRQFTTRSGETGIANDIGALGAMPS